MSAIIETEPTRDQDQQTIERYNREFNALSPENWTPVREGRREGMRRAHPELAAAYEEATERERVRREAAETQAKVQTAAPIPKGKSSDKPQAGIVDFDHHSFRITFERAFAEPPVVVVSTTDGTQRISAVNERGFNVVVAGVNRGSVSWIAMPPTQESGIENL